MVLNDISSFMHNQSAHHHCLVLEMYICFLNLVSWLYNCIPGYVAGIINEERLTNQMAGLKAITIYYVQIPQYTGSMLTCDKFLITLISLDSILFMNLDWPVILDICGSN